MQVKIKKVSEKAVIPKYAKSNDAGLDIVATEKQQTNWDTITYKTGLAFQIPEGHVGLIFPRSSICNYDLELTNSVGILDAGFRGEVLFKFRLTEKSGLARTYDVGDRIGQIIIVPYPKIEFVEVKELEESERGSSGFGSSGK